MSAGQLFVTLGIPATAVASAYTAMRANERAVRRGRHHPGA